MGTNGTNGNGVAGEAAVKERLAGAAARRAAGGEPDYEVIIIGAGFSGIGAAIKLKKNGIRNFVILERAADLGGTWRDNTYPGLAVDITSFTYSYAFEPNPNWSRIFAPGAELQHYAQHCAKKYDVKRYMRFNTCVEKAVFDEDRHVWRVHLNNGEVIAGRYIISATGGLINPKLPEIEGIDSFEGKLIHTARWDHGYDLTGKRAAVIGTGATAVQLIPEIAPKLGHLDVYQRTPIWVLSKFDREIPSWLKTLFSTVPLTQRALRLGTDFVTEIVMVAGVVYFKQVPVIVKRAERGGIWNMKHQLPDNPELWEKLTPHYGFGCKRPTFSNTYFRTFARQNTELITTPIERVTRDGIVTTDGTERKIDVLIAATGYKTFDKGNLPSYEVIGRGGLDLGGFWAEKRFQAYEGTTVPKFPNYFGVLGPYSFTGASWFSMVEAQTTHALRCIKEAKRKKATCVEITQKAHDDHFEMILRRQKDTVFFNNDCSGANSYYFDQHGDAPFLRPASSYEMLWKSRHFPMRHYHFTRAAQRGA